MIRLDELDRFDQIRLLWIRLKGSIPWDYIRLGYGDQILDGLDRIGYDKVEGQIDRQIDRQTDRQIDRLDRSDRLDRLDRQFRFTRLDTQIEQRILDYID